MLHLKDSPVGIDKEVDKIQKKIYQPLVDKWGSLDIYGICSKIYEGNELTLKVYDSKFEYTPVLFSEGNKIFFIQGKRVDTSFDMNTCNLWVVCVLNIQEIYNTNYRETERARIDLCNELYKVLDDESIKGVEYELSSLKSLVEDSLTIGNFKYTDIHPYHLFMVKTSIEYEANTLEC